MAERTYRRQTSPRRSIFIPLVITLLLLVVSGILVISYFNDFYHTEKTHEATLLAQTYANTLETTLDARALLDEQLRTTLRVAGNIVSREEKPFSNRMLADLAKTLNVDVLYVYDNNLQVEHSSDGLYQGWIAPEGHPVRTFYDSGLDQYTDEIRSDSETDTFWLYSYQRYGGGRMVQSGILADKVAELYAQLDEQAIIDRIVKESPFIQIAFIDTRNIVTASSVPSEIGQQIDEKILFQAIEEGPTHLKYVDRRFDWYLKLYIPIQVKGSKVGTLGLLFDLSNTNKLFVQVSLTVTAVLVLLFILFGFTIINIARKNKHIFNVAYFDTVTGLPNISFLKQVLLEQEPKPFALLIINPLHFKFINLIYGYNYGDTLLHQIAGKLSSITLRGSYLQSYRFTDDQFVITVKNYESKQTLYSLCEQILSINEEPGPLGAVDLTIGVVEWNKGALDFDTLIKEASIALNATSETHRIQFYTKEIGQRILRQDTIENELKDIISGKKDTLHLLFQPIVNAKSGSIVSFEALARMQSSTLGRVPPLEFIAIAEERHLIIPLGKVILGKAAAFMKRLTELGYGSYPIGVNVSAMQLLDETFVASFQEITKKAGIEPQQLEIELTESVFSADFEFLAQQIQAIHALGIHIALDDFGTGFSSLNRLEGLVVDTLKLDKQFVDKLIDPEATKISADIVSMVHHLGKHIIAEGVETEQQRQLLLDMNCDYMQGYLFSRPVDEEQVIRLLLEQDSGTRQIHHHE